MCAGSTGKIGLVPEVVDILRGFRGIRRPPPVEVERAIAAIADLQHGLVTRAQLLDLGLGLDGIQRRVSSGRLVLVHRGVFMVGRLRLGQRGHWMAATLACGRRALLSHFSSTGLWELRSAAVGLADVTMVGAAARPLEGVRLHRMRSIRPQDRTVRAGIPVTSLALTTLHMAGMLSHRSLGRLVVKAARRPEFDLEQTVSLCAEAAGHRGVGSLRDIVGRDLTAELRSLSELELRFIELCRHHGIPVPAVNHDVGALMVDAVWKRERVVVELDGYEFHKLPRDLRNDNARNRKLVLAGYRVIRFVWWDLVEDPSSTAGAVKALLACPPDAYLFSSTRPRNRLVRSC